MSDYNDNRDRTPGKGKAWGWVAGLIALAVVVAGVYALSDHRNASTASSGSATQSTAQSPATTR